MVPDIPRDMSHFLLFPKRGSFLRCITNAEIVKETIDLAKTSS